MYLCKKDIDENWFDWVYEDRNFFELWKRDVRTLTYGWLFSICEIYWKYRTAGHLVFWKSWPAVDLKKVLSVTKHGFLFWAQLGPFKSFFTLEIYKAFQDRLTFLNRHMVVWLAGFFRFVKFMENIGLLVFSVLKTLTASRAEKSSKCHKTWFRPLSPA